MTSVEPWRLDMKSVRRSFERAAQTYDASAVIQREVGSRMAERLDVMRLKPAAILDAGCGTGEALGELRARYPDALLIGLDSALNMVRSASARASTQRSLFARLLAPLKSPRVTRSKPALLLCADACRLPLRRESVDLVWSNLMLQWVNEPSAVFSEFLRVLSVGGALVFTTFGPDTLTQLRAAFARIDGAPHVSRFIDMHDIGDMLAQAGFADPVMDMEMMTLTYPDALSMMRDLKAIGAHNAAAGRPRGMMGKARWQRLVATLE